jgi:predicted alpha/beta-fold hydrolase
MQRSWTWCWVLCGVFFLCVTPLLAGEKGNEGDGGPPRPPLERGPDGLPKFHHPYKNGLYATVTAINMFPDLEVKNLQKMKLSVPGFKKDITVQAVIQKHKAPLVVVLLGVDGEVSGPWGMLFPYWYNEYNYNVLTFDNSFTTRYQETCRMGVVGNFDAESDQVAAIIDTFLKTKEAKEHVTDVGVVGMSFGALQALQLAKKDKEGKLPFKLAGCLAISPPVKLLTAARTVDRYFAEDRWDTTMIELAKKFGMHAPVAEGEPIPFEDKELRAAIGYVFRDGLTKLIDRTDSVYRLRILPSEESGQHRPTYAEAYGFEAFVNKFTFPWWEKQGAVKTVDELWQAADLDYLLPLLPDYAEAVVAADDPFTTPEELQKAKAIDKGNHLIVVPNGGHLGFIATDWMLVKALRIFGGRARHE